MSKKKIKLRYLFLFFLIGFLFIHSFENSIFNNYNIKSEESNVLLKMIHTSSSINDFLSYKEITIDHTMVKGSNNLINFPLMISMLDSDLHNETQSDGDDIAFFEGINLLDYEIELFNQTYNNTHAYLVAWVRIPTLSCNADTKIYMYYGNTTMTSQENPSGVWDSNYKGVWHLSEDPTGMIIDSTSKNPYGTTYGEMSLGDSVNGRIAGSLNFDGIDDYVKVNYTTNLNITSALTLETWVKGRGNWWNSNYQYRKKLTINAPATNAIPQQYTMHLQFDHSSLVSAGKSRIDGNDIRLVYWNGLNWYELDRILDIDKPNSWNRNNTKNLFKIQNQIDAGEFDDNYYLYYGNSDAINAPTNEAYIWRYYNSLDSLPILSYANTGGTPTWSVSSGRLKLTHDGSNAARAMISDSPSLTNFIAYVDIEMGSSSSGRAGLVWREQPSGAGYVSRIKIMSDFRLAIINDDSSYYGQIFQNSEVINSGTIYRLRTRAIGSNLTFGFKTISALSYLENNSFDSTYLNGQFGFWGEKVESNGQYWNDLRIKLVLSNEPSIPSQGSEEQCGIHKNNAFSLVLDKSKVAGFINNKVLFTSIDSAWNHLVLTYNGFIQKLYLNGELKEIKSHSGVINTNTNDFIIGNFFNGTIDEIRISNVERSADWIATEYNNFINRQAYEEPEETTTLWSPYVEWSIENSNYSGNPYDIVANVTFFHSNSGTIIKTQMFYDSNNTWKFRFTGTKIGIWSYTTSSNVPNLDGHSGSLKVNPNNNTNNKGFVTNFGNKWGWTGTNEVFVPQFVMYKTPITYFNQLDMIDTDIQTFIVEHGFTGFHTNVYCRWFNVSEDRYDNIDIPNPDQRTFEALELLITKTYNAGGVVHIWAWGDEQRHMTPIKWGINGIEDKRLQRYIAARLGPLPGWTMGYGFDLDEWVTEGELEIWRNYMHQHLGWAHFLGGRPEGPNSGIDHSPYISWNEKLDYSSYEHHKPSYDVYVAALNTIPQQPVFSEDRFRIRDTGYLKDYNMEETRRGLWHSTMAGGVANIWGHLLNSPDGGTASGPYPNPEWIKTNTEFFKNRFKENMVRDNAITNGVCLKAQDNKRYLFYKEDTDSIQINLSDMNGPQQVIAVDTKRVYLEIDLGILNSENQTLYFGNQSDWAIAIGDFNPPDSPSLIKPNNNTIINVNTPYLDWSNLTDISHYHIQISTNSAFSNIVRDIVLPFSEWIVSPALSDGEFYWKVRCNDSTGNWGTWSNFSVFIIDTISPNITLIIEQSKLFGNTPPVIFIDVDDLNLDSIWYLLYNGSISTDNYTWTGSIAQSIWDQVGNGTVILRFYANDTAGNWVFAEDVVRKDVVAPIINITEPNNYAIFGTTPPDINITFIDANLDEKWYQLDNGTITTNNYTWTGFIAQSVWDQVGNGTVIIRFYANDTAGNWVFAEDVVRKDVVAPIINITEPNNYAIFGSTPPDINITFIDSNLDERWYQLDNGTITTNNYTWTGSIAQSIWDQVGNGTVILRFYANDTVGNLRTVEVIIYKNILNPIIMISYPNSNDVFNHNPPNFTIIVSGENLDKRWYILNDGITNYTFTGLTETIDQLAWDTLGDGPIKIKFFINNTLGVIGFDEIIVIKDTIAPLISINLPLNNSYYSNPPIINVLASDGNLDSIWYSVETYNISLINNTDQALSYSIWSILPEGEFHIFLYANDTVGNINDICKLTLHKDSIAPPPPNLLTYPQGKVDIPIIFDWEEGSDPSGISQYRLIIDNEIDPFSTPGFIFEIYINNTSPESSYYKFNQSLSPGTYYFHLFQFDGVDHESNSTSGSFIVIKSDITPPSIQWWIIVLAIVISSLIVAVSIKKIKNKVNKQKNLNKKDKIIKLFNKENGKPQAQQKIADISITYSCINDLLTKFFDDLGIKYYSNPQIYQDYQKIINGLILNENKLFHKFYGNLEIYQRLKAIQIIYTDDLSRENIIHQCQNFQHYDLGLIIVGIKWPRSQNIQTLDIPYDIGIKYRENIQVIHHELFAIKIGLEQNYKVAFNEIIDLYNQMDYEFLHKVHQSNTVRIHNTEELKQDLNRIGLINNDLNEFF